jgi:hypothetical protein
VASALDRIRPEEYFERRTGRMFNTISGCRVVDQTWPEEGSPGFRVWYVCKVVNEGLETHEENFELKGTVEKQNDRWVVSFEGRGS